MNKHGQSIIEYTLIAILVVLGVVIMGPYVLRSIDAHFKMWDDGTRDSFEENLVQAPIADIPAINVDCSCSDTPGSCGGTLVGSECSVTQRIMDHNCTPSQCDQKPTSSCQTDTTCCTAWVGQGCGSFALPVDSSGDVDTSLESSTPPAPNNCYWGQEILSQQCGSGTSIECNNGSQYNCLMPVCQGIVSVTASGTPTATACPNEPPVSSDLDKNYSISYVANQAACGPTQKCQLYCIPPNVLNSANPPTGCIPPPAATITDCSFSCPDIATNQFNGTWTGYYRDSLGANPFWADISVACSSNAMTGICANGCPNGNCTYTRGNTGNQPPCSGNNPPGTIYCNWGGIETITSNLQVNYALDCVNNQIVSINMSNLPIAPNSQCNWSGQQDVQDFGSGNDMYLTCTGGNITQFQLYVGTSQQCNA